MFGKSASRSGRPDSHTWSIRASAESEPFDPLPFVSEPAEPAQASAAYTGSGRRILVSDRGTLGGLTQFLTQFDVSGSATGQ